MIPVFPLCLPLLILFPLLSTVEAADLFELSVIHFNDFHSRFEQTSWKGGTCSKELETQNKCVGGIARIATLAGKLVKEKKNPIFFNAGDNYQGTIWYRVKKWQVVTDLLNMLPLDAVVLGNHEFDDSIAGVLPFIANLKAPIVAANIDDSREPRFQGKVKHYIVIQREGRKIGIIGYLDHTTDTLSKTEKLTFFDEVESVNKAAQALKRDGVQIIFCVSHAGILNDRRVAQQCPDVDVVVGGHSHTLLYTGTPPGGDKAEGVYPEVWTQASGRKVLVVQAGSYSKYLGFLSVKFDAAGEVAEWRGNPILLDYTVAQDQAIVDKMAPIKEELDKKSKDVVGTTLVQLESEDCKAGECGLGNMLTDAMVFEQTLKAVLGKSWTFAAIATLQGGSIRAPLNEVELKGVITYGDLAQLIPFEDSYHVVELQGRHILETLEFSVSNNEALDDTSFYSRGFLHWSGLRVTFDLNQPIGARVVPGTSVLCNECRVPRFEPLDPDKTYRVVTTGFLLGGGDRFTSVRDNAKNTVVGREESEVVINYLKKRGPLDHGVFGRVKLIFKENLTGSSTVPAPIVPALYSALIVLATTSALG